MHKMSSPLLSIIIPTKDRPLALQACLEGIGAALKTLKMAYPEDRIESEVIVCDDSTSSQTASFLKESWPSITYLNGPQKGPAANRNAGVTRSHGEWLVFVDDDCIPQPQWLLELYKNFPKNKALEGCISPQGPLKDLWKCPINLAGGNFWSANIAIKKDLFLKVGGFDPFFPYPAYEDTDLYLRLKKHTPIPFIKEAVVEHPVVYMALGEALKKEYRVLESRAYVLAKHSPGLLTKYNSGLSTKHSSGESWKHSLGASWKGGLKIIASEYYLCMKQILYSFQHRFWKGLLFHFLILFIFLPCLTHAFIKYRRLWRKK